MALRHFALLLTMGIACTHERHVVAPSGAPVVATKPESDDARAILLADYMPADVASRPPKGARTAKPGYPTANTPRLFELRDGKGAILDGMRVVSTSRSMSMAQDISEPALQFGDALPTATAASYVFANQKTLYLAPSFLGPLEPLVEIEGTIQTLSAGFGCVLMRGTNGERWAYDVAQRKSGCHLSIDGALSIATVADGRAFAMLDLGGLVASTDQGKTFKPVPLPQGVQVSLVQSGKDGPWAQLSSNQWMRLEVDGKITRFTERPEKPTDLRVIDETWPLEEPPLRRAVRVGARLDADRAVVPVAGRVAVVSLRTGEVLSLKPGSYSPDAECEATQVRGDIVFFCSGSTQSFIVENVMQSPVVTKNFSVKGTFYLGDDGALAFGAACEAKAQVKASPKVPLAPTDRTQIVYNACVRSITGEWTDVAVSDTSDSLAKTPGQYLELLRWVPRLDGTAIAIARQGQISELDSRTHSSRTWNTEAASNVIYGLSRSSATLDRSWTFARGDHLLGIAGAQTFDVDESRNVHLTPFQFSRLTFAGPYGLALTSNGRLWQSVDHGRTFAEVASPPGVSRSNANAYGGSYYGSSSSYGSYRNYGYNNLGRCSDVGCEMGSFYRIGWPATLPDDRPLTVAPPAPLFEQVVRPILACRSKAEPSQKVISDADPSKLGFGVDRVPADGFTKNDQPLDYLRDYYSRFLDSQAGGGSMDLRLLTFGSAVGIDESGDSGKLMAHAVDKSIAHVTRKVRYVLPFDPTNTIHEVIYRQSDFSKQSRDGEQTFDPIGAVMAVGETADELLLPIANGALIELGQTKRVHSQVIGSSAMTSNAAVLANGDVLLLRDDPSSRVTRVHGDQSIDLFPLPTRADSSGTNADSIAIGPGSEVGVVRLRSGSAPPTDANPPLLYSAAGRVRHLPSWRTVVAANDPRCPATGFRTIIRVDQSWVQVTSPSFSEDNSTDSRAMMRLRFGDKVVCLEGLEVSVEAFSVGPSTPNAGAASYDSSTLIADFTKNIYSRVFIGNGVEVRQPMECTLSTQ